MAKGRLKEKGVPIHTEPFVKGFINRFNLSALWSKIWYRPRYMIQRIRRGYCDPDVWNIDYWFTGIMPAMLEQLREYGTGVPSQLGEDFQRVIADEDEESQTEGEKEWKGILDRMIFLLHEMDEEKCTMENSYEEKYSEINKKFMEKFGIFGEKLKTPEDIKEEKELGSERVFFPDHLPENKEISDRYFEYEEKIEEYREWCKNEFFELFSKYFRALWD